MASYPDNIKQWIDKQDNIDDILAQDVNEAYAEIISIETELDLVKDKINNDDTTIIRAARFVIGTSTSGWASDDVDYLCDGIDDQVEINAAIQALPETGGEIIVLDGTYYITAKIDVDKNNVSIKGNGSATVLKRMWESEEYEGVITLNSVENCKIENLQFDEDEDYHSLHASYGIYTDMSNNISIMNNTFTNNTMGVFLSTSSGCIITNNIYSNNNNCIYAMDSTYNVISNNICKDSVAGFSVILTSNTIISNNIFNITMRSILLMVSDKNIITGNSCFIGNGTPEDYPSSDYFTIRLYSLEEEGVYYHNNYNLISSNICMGKAVEIDGGIGNSNINNKWNETDDSSASQPEFTTLSHVDNIYTCDISLKTDFLIDITDEVDKTISVSNVSSGFNTLGIKMIFTEVAIINYFSNITWINTLSPVAGKTYYILMTTNNGGDTWSASYFEG